MNPKSFLNLLGAIVGYGINFPYVKVHEGILEGTKYVTEQGTTAYKFLGIPYAAPPVGDLRFKAPNPPSRWTGIRKAKEWAKICKSYPLHIDKITDEDCLYLDVYTTNTDPSKKLFPVMVFIPGGGFQAVFRDPVTDWLIMENVVLVTMAYRVGVFGFFQLDIPEAPGNAGLKDQVAAFRWIKKNIAAFGGDPENIMIFGQSAGGVSVNYHLVSDMTKGLFHKAAMMSGCALNPWAYVLEAKKYGMKLGSKMNCPTDSESNTLHCLLSKSPDEILQTVGKPAPSSATADENMYYQELVFLPSIEKTFKGQEAFFTETSYRKIINEKFYNVPVMAGYTDAESIIEVNDTVVDPVLYGLTNINFERYIPRELCLKDGSKESLRIADKVREFYYGKEPINESVDNFIVIKSDTNYKRGTNEMVKKIANGSRKPIYYYRFSCYDPDMRRATGLVMYKGASHADDLFYLYIDSDALPRYKPEIEKVRRRMVKLYSNFAKYGNPTPEITDLLPIKWKPVTKYNLNYLSIDKDLGLSTNPDRKSIQFWENLVKNSKSYC